MTTTDTTTAPANASQIRMTSSLARSSLCDAQFSIALNTPVALYPSIVRRFHIPCQRPGPITKP